MFKKIRFLLYFLPVLFISSIICLLIVKSPQNNIALRALEEPKHRLHVFEGYKILGTHYETDVIFTLFDIPGKIHLLQNTLASCYAKCLRDKKCIAASSDIQKEDGKCILYTSIKRIIKDPKSKILFRFSDKEEHRNYNIIPNIDIFSNNIADFTIAENNSQPIKTCYQACINNKKCRSFVLINEPQQTHCWLKNSLENQDFIYSENKRDSNVNLGLIGL